MQRQISPAFHNRRNAEHNKRGDEVLIASPRMMTIFVPSSNTNTNPKMAVDPPTSSDSKVEARQNPLHSSRIFRPKQIVPGGPNKAKAATKATAVEVSAIKARKNLPPTPNKGAANKAVKKAVFTPPKVIVVVEAKETNSDVPRVIQVPQDMATGTATRITTTAKATKSKTPTKSRARSHHSSKTPPQKEAQALLLEKTKNQLQMVSSTSTPATRSTSLDAPGHAAADNGPTNQRLVPVEQYRRNSSSKGESANTASKSETHIASTSSKNDELLKPQHAKPVEDVEVTATVASTSPSSMDASDRVVPVTSIVVDQQQSSLRAPTDPPAAMAPTTLKKTILPDFTGMAKLRYMDQLSLSASSSHHYRRRASSILSTTGDHNILHQSWPLPSSAQSRSAAASLYGLPEDPHQRRRHSTVHMTSSSRPPSSRMAIAASRPAQWLDATGTPEDWIRASASSSARTNSGSGGTNDYINLRKEQAGQSNTQHPKETNPQSHIHLKNNAV